MSSLGFPLSVKGLALLAPVASLSRAAGGGHHRVGGAGRKPGRDLCTRAGGLAFVTGTAPVDEDGRTFAPGDGYRQARRCLEIVERALQALGVQRKDVVRTRMFVTDIQRWPEFARAHKEFFGDHPPCTTMVEVRALIDPEMLIEVEADAVCTVETR